LIGWTPTQVFYLHALGFKPVVARRPKQAPAPMAGADQADAVARHDAASGFSSEGSQRPLWVVLALERNDLNWRENPLCKRVFSALGLALDQLAWIQPAQSHAHSAGLVLHAHVGTICLGAGAQAWLLQQAQANPLGQEAALILKKLLVWPAPAELQTAAGKRALWQAWAAQLRP